MRRARQLTVALLPLVSTALAAQSAAVRRSPVVEVVERVAPAVVNISAESIVRRADPFFGGFFGSRPRRTQSLGSGLIIDSGGVVVTNAHVIEGASRIVVTTRDGRELEADVLGADRDADLAVLKVQARALPATPLGRSADLLMGETVVAIGNPFGLSHTVTTGVLSARGRTVAAESGEARYTDFLQTDASINPGNSGGPLVNLAGQVIGINTAIVQGANGIGFAIPADRAQRVVDDLLRFGELQPLWTGLRLETVDAELARREGLPGARGALVVRVFPDSPAARAGVQAGDLLASVADKPIAAREDLTTAFHSVAPGTPIRVEVRRGERSFVLALSAVRPPRGLGLEVLAEALGLAVTSSGEGLAIGRVANGSEGERIGLRAGDRLLAANGQRLASAEQLGHEVLRALDRGSLFLVVGRGRYAYNLNLPM
ncbi:MAG: PDZ domain-containing protein [Thermoanaerobaculia bacterium]|nr:MAG: PDZ domain-containing protein [Thermoanaerobaculia bacterium]MBZ0100967.1 trypsin-like peptidase domain-containing protein [Thermoanaerobaculia bacterium]